ncbi:hypothetical protein LOD99_12936 [Oopsacas minuta]|uniref:Uncharacterized protein n=1 Tax=Oopsacas minuta TaxID=111878 RepID=A0AAV7J8D5_9METZ|nr:hypothetical protein LOD99_12936 [Oopsacas minuta]
MRILFVVIFVVYCYCQRTENTDCSNTKFGCCSDGKTTADDSKMANCPKPFHLIGGCNGTQFGCCPDGSYAKDLQKSNCIIKNINDNPEDRNVTNKPLNTSSSIILISIGSALFSFIIFSIILLLIISVIIIVYRMVKQRQARRMRLILECEEPGVEMGSPLMVEEFGVKLSL